MFLFEVMAETVPAMRRHIGPPVSARENAEKFLDKYIQEEVFAGPYIEDNRYIVEPPQVHPRRRSATIKNTP